MWTMEEYKRLNALFPRGQKVRILNNGFGNNEIGKVHVVWMPGGELMIAVDFQVNDLPYHYSFKEAHLEVIS